MNTSTSRHDVADKLAYVHSHLEDVLWLGVSSGLFQASSIRDDGEGYKLIMLVNGGWMTVDGATRAGLFDHLIPDDLADSPVVPANIAELMATRPGPIPDVEIPANVSAS